MNPSKVATNAITLTETMEAHCATIKEKLAHGKINEQQATKFTAKATVNFIECGKSLSQLMIEFKEQGFTTQKFDEYLETVFGIKPRMRQRYVQIATNERTKDADEKFFSKMINPTLTNVINGLSLDDDDWEKVINGDNTPFESKFKTTDEKELVLKKEFEKVKLGNIDFENFKVYFNNSKTDLIGIIDTLISNSSVFGIVNEPKKEDNERIYVEEEEESK